MAHGEKLTDEEKEFAQLLLDPDLQEGEVLVLVRSIYEDTLDIGVVCLEIQLGPDDKDVPDGIGLVPVAILLTPAVKDFFFDKLTDPFKFYDEEAPLRADLATPPELPSNGETA